MRTRPNWISIASALLASILAEAAGAEWTDWIAEADVNFRYDSNLNNAGFGSEEEHDFIWRPSVRAGRVYQFPGMTRLRVSAEVLGEIHHQWSDLDSIEGLGHLALSHKFGLGNAPWVRAFFSGGYESVDDGDRSGYRLATGAMAGKRLTDRFTMSLGYRFTATDGENGGAVVAAADTDVFDQEYHDISVEGRFMITQMLLLRFGYEFRHGDLYSNARGRRMLVPGMADVEAVARDRVFGGWSYRLRGDAHTPFVSLNYGIGDHWSIDASYRYRYAESKSLDYENHVAGFTILFRY